MSSGDGDLPGWMGAGGRLDATWLELHLSGEQPWAEWAWDTPEPPEPWRFREKPLVALEMLEHPAIPGWM